MSIIFIEKEVELVWKIAPIEKGAIFLNGLLFNLTVECQTNEQPIRITEDGKARVISFLERKYLSDKRTNKLIKFFRDIPIGNYIYIFLYNEQVENFFDVCKQTLDYYNNGMTYEEVASKIVGFIEKIQEAENFLNILPYNWNALLPHKKIRIGEQDKKRRKCIYCGGYIDDGETSFKEIAHAIPEALRNTKFIQNEECDSCNGYFSNNAEEDLSNMLVWKRLKYGLKGKEGYPIFQFDHNTFARYFDAENEDYEKDWGYFEVAKSIIKERGKKAPAIVTVYREDIKDRVDIAYVKEYLPMHVYKTLVKCVIGLIGNDKLTYFAKTINWLRYDEKYHKLPKVARLQSKRMVMEPELYIFTRKDDLNYSLPYCFGDFRILDDIFVFIVPYCERDKKRFLTDQECIQFRKLLDILYTNYEWIDFSDTSPQKIQESFVEIERLV